MERLRAVSIEFTSRFAHPCRGKQPLTWKSVVVQRLAPQRELWAAPCQLPARKHLSLIVIGCQPEIASSLEQETRIPEATSGGEVERYYTSAVHL